MHPQYAYNMCRQSMYRYVRMTTTDGKVYDGFIADVNPTHVTLAIPTDQMIEEYRGKSARNADFRQFGLGFGRRRFFRRLVLPLFLLSSIAFLPFF